jgi:hypothetical protein
MASKELFAVAALAMASSAVAKDLVVTDQEQGAILVICEIAARSPAAPIETTATVAQWCVGWKQRIQSASTPVPPQPLPQVPKP